LGGAADLERDLAKSRARESGVAEILYATLGRIGFGGRYQYGAIHNLVVLAQRLSAEAKASQTLLSQRGQAKVESDADTTPIGDLTLKGSVVPSPPSRPNR
jgi:hypothetical protein